MAIWQYDFTLVPEFGLIEHHGVVPEKIDAYFYDDDPEEKEYPNYWSEFDSEKCYCKDAETLLGKLNSWSDEGIMFGTEDGNKIEIWKEGGINCRFDVRNPDLEILESFMRLARKNGCLVLSHASHRVIKPELNLILEDIRSSKAYKFCKDPKGFLTSINPEI